MTLLDVKQLSISYRSASGLVPAVKQASFTLEKNQSLGLIGESGCGKTTIGMGILKLLPANASITGGSILFNQVDLVQLPEGEMQKIRGDRISMIFQAAMNSLNPVHRVGNQIIEALQAHNANLSKDKAIEKVKQLFEEVGIMPERMFDFPHQYSGGMKQRAIIAMALSCDPDLIIADEPTTALDMVVQRQILSKIVEIQKHRDVAILLISHDMGVIAEVCHHIAVMNQGEMIEYGSRLEILNTPAHPYTRKLLSSYLTIDGTIVLPEFKPRQNSSTDPKLLSGCCFANACNLSEEACLKSSPHWKTLSATHKVRCLC